MLLYGVLSYSNACEDLMHSRPLHPDHPPDDIFYWLFGFASKKYHPVDDLDAESWNALNMRTRYYTTRLHKGAFYLPAFLEEMLEEVEE